MTETLAPRLLAPLSLTELGRLAVTLDEACSDVATADFRAGRDSLSRDSLYFELACMRDEVRRALITEGLARRI